MDLTKELLAGASFRAKGKWYAAQQVDAFLEELSVRLEEDSREREELAEDARALRRENARLREELAAALAQIEATKGLRADPPGSVSIHYGQTGFFREVYNTQEGVIEGIKKYLI